MVKHRGKYKTVSTNNHKKKKVKFNRLKIKKLKAIFAQVPLADSASMISTTNTNKPQVSCRTLYYLHSPKEGQSSDSSNDFGRKKKKKMIEFNQFFCRIGTRKTVTDPTSINSITILIML